MICFWKSSIYAMFRIHWKPIKSDRESNFPESLSRYLNKINNRSLNTCQKGLKLILFECFHHLRWAVNTGDVPQIRKQKMQSEKYLISIIWGSTKIKSLLYVPKGMKHNTTFFVESVVPDLVEYVCQESRRKTLRGIMVHLDNVRPHNSRKRESALTARKAHRIPALAYNPDQPPSDFFLFGMLKERVSVTSYSSPGELISTISELISSLAKGQLVSVYKNYTKRLNWVIEHRSEYYRK
jgi:hypothetical protein